MISRIRGTLISNDLERIEIQTTSGVVYEIEVPLTILTRLPQVGSDVEVRTAYIVREDSATLFGFIEPHERTLFQRLLGATGVGPKLALAMMSTLNASRLARALSERDIAALTQVSGVGKKTAERISLALADRVKDLVVDGGAARSETPGVEEAVQALVALGYSPLDADDAVRKAVDTAGDAPVGAQDLIRRALAARA